MTAFRDASYYCLECPLGYHSKPFHGVFGVQKHLEDVHNYPPQAGENGVDYCTGWQAKQIYGRRVLEADRLGDLLETVFASAAYTVEDFLTDTDRS